MDLELLIYGDISSKLKFHGKIGLELLFRRHLK